MKTNPVKNQVSLYDSQEGCVWVTDFYLAEPYFVFRVTPFPDYHAKPESADIVMRELRPREHFMEFGTGPEYKTLVMPQDYILHFNRMELIPLITEARIEAGVHRASFF